MKDIILIKDWCGNILFEGKYNSKRVDKVLGVNRCHCYNTEHDFCDDCNGTGYSTDFYIFWKDENREDNVYEFIYY